MFRALGQPYATAYVLTTLGDVASDQRDDGRAHQLYAESVPLWLQVGNLVGIALCLKGWAAVAQRAGQLERAARLWGAAEVLLERSSDQQIHPAIRAAYDRDHAAARVVLEQAGWAAAWKEGRAMTLEQTIAYALEDDGSMV